MVWLLLIFASCVKLVRWRSLMVKECLSARVLIQCMFSTLYYLLSYSCNFDQIFGNLWEVKLWIVEWIDIDADVLSILVNISNRSCRLFTKFFHWYQNAWNCGFVAKFKCLCRDSLIEIRMSAQNSVQVWNWLQLRS